MILGLGLIVVAAGSSQRMEGTDKVWASLGGMPVVMHSLARLSRVAQHAVLVVRSDEQERARRELSILAQPATVVPGGMTRRDSVACGLAALPDVRFVAVHDAARPFAPVDLMLQGVDMLDGSDGAVPGLSVTDTIKEVDGDSAVVRTLDRPALRAVQTPQLFRRDALEQAHALSNEGTVPTDDAAMLETRGFTVRVYAGRSENFKITTQFDLTLARLLIAQGLTA